MSDQHQILTADHPAPWTAWYVRSEEQYDLLDAHGGSICKIKDPKVARGFVRLVNNAARQRAALAPLAPVIPLAGRETAEAPPAPDPLNGAATTWAELFDHLIYLLDDQQLDVLRKRLFEYARVTTGLPLPSAFTPNEDPGDHHA